MDIEYPITSVHINSYHISIMLLVFPTDKSISAEIPINISYFMYIYKTISGADDHGQVEGDVSGENL